MKPVVYVVTSCKGGIGKTTVTANLAAAIADRGHRVLCVDCDYSNRALDLIFGTGSTDVPGIDVIIRDGIPAAGACVTVREDRLWFVPGPSDGAVTFTREQFEDKLTEIVSGLGCDTVFIDTPGASDGILPTVAPCAGVGIIVTSHTPTSVRGAERMGKLLSGYGIDDQYLIVNRFDGKSAAKGERPGVNELIDRTCVRLLGVVPDSRDLELAQEEGILADSFKRDRDRVCDSFDEIAARLCGERLPLFSYLPERKRKKLIVSVPKRKRRENY